MKINIFIRNILKKGGLVLLVGAAVLVSDLGLSQVEFHGIKPIISRFDTTVSLVYHDTLTLPSYKDFSLHVKMKPAAQISAISLGFYFPNEYLEIDSLKLADDRKYYHQNITDSLFQVVWSDVNPINISENDTIITLYMRSLDISNLTNTIRLGLYESSEFADVSASVIEDVILEIPEIEFFKPDPGDTISGYSFRVYPNPFDDYTTIDFTLKEESELAMSLYSPDGKKIYEWGKTSYPEGNHLVRIYAMDLAKGISLLKVKINNPEISATKIMKILAIE